MLAKSLDVIDNEEWIADFGELMGQHVTMYQNAAEEKVGWAVARVQPLYNERLLATVSELGP